MKSNDTSDFNLTFAQAMALVENGATVVCENDPYKPYKYIDNNLMIRYPWGWTQACLFG